MTQWINEKTNYKELERTTEEFPPASEKMSIEEMILGLYHQWRKTTRCGG